MATISQEKISQALDAWAEHILKGRTSCETPQAPLALVGLISHGDILAQRLVARLKAAGCEAHYGAIDISLYRDDFNLQGQKLALRTSYLPFSTDDMQLILIDDVIYTGRTIRAALNAIFDYGRPAKVELQCLAQRPGRELPIQPDYCPFSFEQGSPQGIKLQLQELDGQDLITY